MKRARIDEVKEAIKNMPADKQRNVMEIAKTHGVTKRFVELANNPEKRPKKSIDSWIQNYIDELKDE